LRYGYRKGHLKIVLFILKADPGAVSHRAVFRVRSFIENTSDGYMEITTDNIDKLELKMNISDSDFPHVNVFKGFYYRFYP
jgi:hypothetical protein